MKIIYVDVIGKDGIFYYYLATSIITILLLFLQNLIKIISSW